MLSRLRSLLQHRRSEGRAGYAWQIPFSTVRICVFLQNCPLFSGLSPSRLVEVAQQVRKEVHPPGATIIRQGEIGDKFCRWAFAERLA